DVGRQLGLFDAALVGIEAGGGGSGEPDRVVGLDYHVVRRVERLAVELVDQHRYCAVMLGARQAPRVVLAGDETALAVASVAVGVVLGLAVDAGAPGHLVPAQDAVVWDVAPKDATGIPQPHRPLAPARAGVEPLDARLHHAIAREAR